MQAGSGETIAQALLDASPPVHGLQRVKDGFDIEETVAEYNILRRCIHDLADRNGLRMSWSGLRLAIVKTFIEAHDELVTVESELGVGSTFRFTLPGQHS